MTDERLLPGAGMDAEVATRRMSGAELSGPISHAIFRLARIHRAMAGRLLRNAGLHPGQEQVMMRLWEAGPQRQVDLLAVLDCDAATMTRMVGRLENAGFVHRTPSPTDRRVTIIKTTAAGLALRERVERIWRELEALTAGGLDEQERTETLRVLRRLEQHLTGSADAEPVSQYVDHER